MWWLKRKIDQVADNANEAWKAAAHRRVRDLARTREWFTSEDVLTWLDQRGYKTKDKRALGAIMQHYQKDGWIAPAGWTPARRKERHHAPVRRWQSQVYGFNENRWGQLTVEQAKELNEKARQTCEEDS